MSQKKRIEERDGKTFEVTVLPSDHRLRPSQVKKRQLFQALSAKEKREFFKEKRKAAAKKRRKKR